MKVSTARAMQYFAVLATKLGHAGFGGKARSADGDHDSETSWSSSRNDVSTDVRPVL